MNLQKKIVAGSAGLLFLLLALTIYLRTRPAPTLISQGAPVAPVPLNADRALQRFAGALRIQTISEPIQPPNAAAIQAFRDYLEVNFPRVHRTMHREIVGPGALLFTWPGTDPSLTPVLLMGHMDVVPVDPASLSHWKHPPFAGEIADGYVWGRGAMDDKQAVLSLLEASEALLARNFQPRRTIYFAFGDDEENDGHGAEAIAALLKSRNVHPEFVMDEGGNVARGTVPGVNGDVALIGIAEKGIASVQLTVTAAGGHSSRPPRHTAIGILSRAIARLEANQMPARLTGVTGQMLDAVSPEMGLKERILVRNRWLFRPWLLHSLGETPGGNALIRTTTAVTIFQAGVKDNVLPSRATAVVNFRILPGDTVDSLLRHVREAIDDNRVGIALYGLSADASPISPVDTPPYTELAQTIHQFFPQAALAPNLLVARTDSVRYYSIASNVYRFFPAIRDEHDGERIHGTNERLGTADYLRAVQFMAALMQREAQ